MYFTFEVEGEIVLLIPKFFAGSILCRIRMSAFVYRVTQNQHLTIRLTSQIMSGIPVSTVCLKWGGTIWAGADPRAVVKRRAWVLKWKKPESLYSHPVFSEKTGSLGFIVKCLLHQ